MATNRYTDIAQKVSNGKRVTHSVVYPPIPRDITDIYIVTTIGDRLDLLAKKYYSNISYWWIIAEANAVGKGSFTLPAGIQLRIPTNTSKIITNFNRLNS